MKKVLFTATVDSHILQFHLPYLKWFKEQGYEVHVATNGDETIPYCDIKHKISFERSPFKINNLKAIKQLKKIIDNEKFDIIHCHTPMGSVVTRLAAKEARKHGTKVIYTAHGFHFYKGAPLINWIVFYPIEKWLSRYTDCLITINEEDYNLAKRKFKAKQIELVHGVGVDENKFNFEMSKEEKHELRKSIGLKDDDFVIIYVAELSKRKNQGMLIKAVKELINEGKENIKVLLPGIDSMNGYYQEMSKNLGIENNIKFLGYRKDIPKLLKISDLYVSTSKQEGLPVNVMEAMVCGLPIVATDCRGNRDLVKENGYIITLNKIDELKNKILLIINNYLKRKNNMEDYCRNTIMPKMEKIYNDILKKRVIMLRTTSIINDSRITKEAKTLQDAGYDVKILGWDRDGFFQSNGNNENLKNIEIKLYTKKSKYGSGIKNIFKLLSFEIWLLKNLCKNKNNIDIIHSCDLDTAIPAKKISKKYNKKLVYDIFDYYVDSHYVPRSLKRMIEKQEINIINSADLVILCTEERKRQIQKANPKKCIVIYNTPDIENYNLDRKIIKSSSNKIKLAYVGILQENRLLKEIGETIKKYPDIELHIGGFGEYEEYFEELSKEYSNVFYYGRMKYEDVLCLEKDCDILFATYNPVIANHRYSAPNKLYEAMALNKPIIVCKNTGIDRIVEQENSGYVIRYDSNDFFSIIEEKYHNFRKISEEINNKEYLWKTMKNRLLEEYKLF